MNIGELRAILKAWLATKLRIDRWGLGLPDSIQDSDRPTSIGLDKPALDINFDNKGWGQDRLILVETTIPFQVIYRFDSSYQYDLLPRGEAETLLNQMLFELQAPNCLHQDIELVEPSGSVSIAEHKNSDWLLIFELDIKVQFQSESNRINNQYFSP
ncbi:hypothetical protein H6G36_25695 [Anabaena minutissima FACHB-250]|nr:hypothetical protein [Anabaena minutissima FACHB-250]